MNITHKVKRSKTKTCAELDINTAVLAQLKVIYKQLVGATIVPINVNKFQTLWYDLCG